MNRLPPSRTRGVGVAEGLQAVLGQIGPLALVAYQQDLVVLAVALQGAGDLDQIHIGRAGNGGLEGDVDELVALGLALGILPGGEGLKFAAELVAQDVQRVGEGMDGRGEGRGVGVVRAVQVGQGGLATSGP